MIGERPQLIVVSDANEPVQRIKLDGFPRKWDDDVTWASDPASSASAEPERPPEGFVSERTEETG